MSGNSSQFREPQLLDRFCYHSVGPEGRESIEDTRAAFVALVLKLDELVPNGREKALVMTHLETASFFAIAGIARG